MRVLLPIVVHHWSGPLLGLPRLHNFQMLGNENAICTAAPSLLFIASAMRDVWGIEFNLQLLVPLETRDMFFEVTLTLFVSLLLLMNTAISLLLILVKCRPA